MRRATLLLWFAALLCPASAQQLRSPRAANALKELSASLEALASQTGRAIVQILSTGYVVGGEEASAGVLSTQRSSGSGVILSPDGYIVTNAHVVQGARRIRVQLAPGIDDVRPQHSVLKRSGPVVTAKLIGADRESDLAVLKIERTGLPFLPLANSEAVREGQLVMAFGNPLGLQNSVTLGVVSSTSRQLKPDDPMIYIQTDAPMNPGNSGGPLLDMEGRVVGINTFIFSQSGGSEGIGFSIPSNIVRTVFEQIRKSGHVRRGQIGVHAQTITPLLAQGLRLPQDWGVLLGDVDPEGPARKAGLEVGDIVLDLDGKTMENARQFEVNVYRRLIGEKVTLRVLRGSEQLTVQVPVIEYEDDPERFADLVTPEDNLVSKLGILGIGIDQRIAAMVPDIRKQYGVVVAARAADAPYTGGGVQPGDIIYSVNSLPVTNVAALRETLDNLKPGDPAVLQIERSNRLMYLVLQFE